MMENELATDHQLPAEVTSPQGKLVYLYLDATGGATLADLNETLAMNKMSVLSVLESLSSQGLVERAGAEYVTANGTEQSPAAIRPLSATSTARTAWRALSARRTAGTRFEGFIRTVALRFRK